VVLTILSESASAVESMVRTTMLKLDRAKNIIGGGSHDPDIGGPIGK
jgi:hypothetical protein